MARDCITVNRTRVDKVRYLVGDKWQAIGLTWRVMSTWGRALAVSDFVTPPVPRLSLIHI